MGADNEVIVKVDKGVQIITFNRPHRKNAFNKNTYNLVAKALKEAATDDTIFISVLTGIGDFFSSGFDFKELGDGDITVGTRNPIRNFIDTIIDFPKFLIAVVNGPAIGIGCTILPLCDIVYAAENSYFLTPFSKLGVTAEGCSSYTFPKILGHSKAGEMLYLSKKLSAEEAVKYGLVSELLNETQLKVDIWQRIADFTKLSMGSIRATKLNIRHDEIERLHEINRREMEAVDARVAAPDTLGFMMASFKSKL